MTRTAFIGILVLLLAALQLVPTGHLRAQMQHTVGHEHLTEVACVDVPTGKKRPEFGCFNIGVVTELHFSQPSVYWHLRASPSRKAAEAAKSATGIVVEEAGRAWLSEFRAPNSALPGGEAVAIVGPPSPEGWYVLAGEQCLETPAGANRIRTGATMASPNIPMELNVTGTTVRRAFALVIHDSAQQRGIPSDWKPSGACSQ